MARKWIKNPNYGTVVLPTGKVLNRPDEVVEGDQWAKIASKVGLIELLEEPRPAPSARLLTDAQAGSHVALTEQAPAAEAVSEAAEEPADGEPPEPQGTTTESIDGRSRRRQRTTRTNG